MRRDDRKREEREGNEDRRRKVKEYEREKLVEKNTEKRKTGEERWKKIKGKKCRNDSREKT